MARTREHTNGRTQAQIYSAPTPEYTWQLCIVAEKLSLLLAYIPDDCL
jgi:hypothetical protein